MTDESEDAGRMWFWEVEMPDFSLRAYGRSPSECSDLMREQWRAYCELTGQQSRKEDVAIYELVGTPVLGSVTFPGVKFWPKEQKKQ
jgi:hypothetical protein